MNSIVSSRRKCSAVLAAGAGAAVCLTGGGPAAGAVNHGFVSSLNGGQKSFTVGVTATNANIFPSLHATLGKVGAGLRFYIPYRNFATTPTGTQVTSRLGYVATDGVVPGIYVVDAFSVNAPIGPLWPHFFRWGYVPAIAGTKYFGVKYPVSLTDYRYGWVSVTSAAGNKIVFDQWSFNSTSNGSIFTLADCVTTRKLDLSDGRAKLHWGNANEEGVARYEVQAKDASGAWKAVDSSAPGESRYSATVAKDAACRLVVEMVDGATHEVAF